MQKHTLAAAVALLGGLVGAVLASAGPDGLRIAVVANKALLPLLLVSLAMSGRLRA